jgi:hypothetical protein
VGHHAQPFFLSYKHFGSAVIILHLIDDVAEAQNVFSGTQRHPHGNCRGRSRLKDGLKMLESIKLCAED